MLKQQLLTLLISLTILGLIILMGQGETFCACGPSRIVTSSVYANPNQTAGLGWIL